MNILFENSYVRNEEWAKDIFSYLHFRMPAMIICYIALAANFALQIYHLIAGNGVNYLNLIVFALLVAYVIYTYKAKVKTVLRRDLEIHGKPIEITTVVTEENIKINQSTGSELCLGFSDIKKAVKTKKHIFIWSKTNMLYTFDKNAFTVGDENTFVDYLKSKGISIK